MPPLGEKSGPDFYADLLESAREQVRETDRTEKAKEPKLPETKEKDPQPAETVKTT